jgi:murein DD-endopeptidase MepM/ murein hydrolase activator NlpD
VSEGEKIFSLDEGVVVNARSSKSYGNFITYKTKDNYEITCGHLSKMFVKENDSIKKNDVIALTGNTGLSTGPHLHLAIKRNGIFLNPEELVTLE